MVNNSDWRRAQPDSQEPDHIGACRPAREFGFHSWCSGKALNFQGKVVT